VAYGATVTVLIFIIHDERVEWYEALILVLLYFVYIAVMYYDKAFQKCARGERRQRHWFYFTPFQLSISSGGLNHARNRTSSVRVKTASPEGGDAAAEPNALRIEHFQHNGNIVKNISLIDASNNDVPDALEMQTKGGTKATVTVTSPTDSTITTPCTETPTSEYCSSKQEVVSMSEKESGDGKPENAAVIEPHEVRHSLVKYPKTKSVFKQFTWILTWPIHLVFMLTIPDCERPSLKKWFPLTFIMCIIWIGSLSYFVAWMITIIGEKTNLEFFKGISEKNRKISKFWLKGP
jgi:Ca2+/Na+ antiporter